MTTMKTSRLWIEKELEREELIPGMSLIEERNSRSCLRYFVTYQGYKNFRCVINFSRRHPFEPPVAGYLACKKWFGNQLYRKLQVQEFEHGHWLPTHSLNQILLFLFGSLEKHVTLNIHHTNAIHYDFNRDIYMCILEFLPLRDIGAFGQASRSCWMQFSCEELWTHLLLARPPISDAFVSTGSRIGLTKLLVDGESCYVGSKSAYRRGLEFQDSLKSTPNMRLFFQQSTEMHMLSVIASYERVLDTISILYAACVRQRAPREPNAGSVLVANRTERHFSDSLPWLIRILKFEIKAIELSWNDNRRDSTFDGGHNSSHFQFELARLFNTQGEDLHLEKFKTLVQNKISMWKWINNEKCDVVGKLVLLAKVGSSMKKSFFRLVESGTVFVDVQIEDGSWVGASYKINNKTAGEVQIFNLDHGMPDFVLRQETIETKVAPYRSRSGNIEELVENEMKHSFVAHFDDVFEQVVHDTNVEQGVGSYVKVPVRATGFGLVTYVTHAKQDLQSIIADYMRICKHLKPHGSFNIECRAFVVQGIDHVADWEKFYLGSSGDEEDEIHLEDEGLIITYLELLRTRASMVEDSPTARSIVYESIGEEVMKDVQSNNDFRRNGTSGFDKRPSISNATDELNLFLNEFKSVRQLDPTSRIGDLRIDSQDVIEIVF